MDSMAMHKHVCLKKSKTKLHLEQFILQINLRFSYKVRWLSIYQTIMAIKGETEEK